MLTLLLHLDRLFWRQVLGRHVPVRPGHMLRRSVRLRLRIHDVALRLGGYRLRGERRFACVFGEAFAGANYKMQHPVSVMRSHVRGRGMSVELILGFPRALLVAMVESDVTQC